MDHRLPLDGRAFALMLLLCATWSLQQISLKAVAADASPMLMIGLRSGVAAALVAVTMRWRGESLALPRALWGPGAAVGALFALEYLVVAQALKLTHAAHVIVFLYTAPIFAALGLHARLPAERLGALQWVGIGVAFGGVALAFLGGEATAATSSAPREMALSSLVGDLLALAGAIAWGATTVTIRCTPLSRASASQTLLVQLLGAFVLLLPAAALTGQWHFTPTPAVWGHFAFQSVGVSFASFLLWFWLLRHYLASPLGVLTFLTPVLGVLLGWALLGEALTRAFLAGGVLVLAGVLLVSARSVWRGVSVARPAFDSSSPARHAPPTPDIPA